MRNNPQKLIGFVAVVIAFLFACAVFFTLFPQTAHALTKIFQSDLAFKTPDTSRS